MCNRGHDGSRGMRATVLTLAPVAAYRCARRPAGPAGGVEPFSEDISKWPCTARIHIGICGRARPRSFDQ